MNGKVIGGIILLVIVVGLFVPINSSTFNGGNSSTNSSSLVITYGETTYNNPTYKDTVNSYFKDKSGLDLSNANNTVITASDVNKVAQSISQRTYNSNQVLSCAMLDLSGNNDIQVDVDTSKITTVTPEMYKSALNSSGITKGHVYVTSPTVATGESALAGIMKSYETATGKQIPDTLKNSATKEIYTETSIVNQTGADPNKVADLVTQAKDQVSQQNVTDQNSITNIIINIASNNNINITQTQASDLASSISQSQQAQGQASDYQSQISNAINNTDTQSLIQQIWNMIQSYTTSSQQTNST
jgi:uncharacterized protein YpuA (DUF1002 family)